MDYLTKYLSQGAPEPHKWDFIEIQKYCNFVALEEKKKVLSPAR